jgi:hypothetical protein
MEIGESQKQSFPTVPPPHPGIQQQDRILPLGFGTEAGLKQGRVRSCLQRWPLSGSRFANLACASTKRDYWFVAFVVRSHSTFASGATMFGERLRKAN